MPYREPASCQPLCDDPFHNGCHRDSTHSVALRPRDGQPERKCHYCEDCYAAMVQLGNMVVDAVNVFAKALTGRAKLIPEFEP